MISRVGSLREEKSFEHVDQPLLWIEITFEIHLLSNNTHRLVIHTIHLLTAMVRGLSKRILGRTLVGSLEVLYGSEIHKLPKYNVFMMGPSVVSTNWERSSRQSCGPWVQRGHSFASSSLVREQEQEVEQTFENKEILANYQDKMESLKKKRKKVPLSTGESYEAWLEKYDVTLEPLRDFFRMHDMDAEWAIAELYKNGYWGKKLMGTISKRRDSEDASEEGQEGKQYEWEKALDIWNEAFKAENLPHAALDIVRRWPSLLCKTPDCLPGTVAVLRAAIPDEDALNETVASFPRVLIQSPVKLQHRVLALQMACGMDLSRILPKNPQMFYRNLEAIMTNIRFLRDHSWSLEHFESLIDYRPTILTMHPDMVNRNTKSSLEGIQAIILPGSDAKLVIRAKPQLILIPPVHIAERWESLIQLTDQVPEWKQEVQDALEDIAMASSQQAPRPEGLDETLHPGKTFGAEKTQSPKKTEEEEISVEEWEAGEWGSTTIGAALWAHPKRHERLEYLVLHPEEAGNLSFVDALTVHFHRFNHRYNDFEEWCREKYE